MKALLDNPNCIDPEPHVTVKRGRDKSTLVLTCWGRERRRWMCRNREEAAVAFHELNDELRAICNDCGVSHEQAMPQ